MSLMWMESWGNRASPWAAGDARFAVGYYEAAAFVGVNDGIAVNGENRRVCRLGKDVDVAATSPNNSAPSGYIEIPIPSEGCIFSASVKLDATGSTYPALLSIIIGAGSGPTSSNTILHIRNDGAVFSKYTASGGVDIYGGALGKSLKIDFEVGADKRSVKVWVDDLIITNTLWGSDISLIRFIGGYINSTSGAITVPVGVGHTAYLTDMMMFKNDGVGDYRRPGKHGRVIPLAPTSDIEVQWQTTDGSKTHAELLSSQMVGAATPAYIAAGSAGETDSFEFSDLPASISDDYGNLTDVSTLQIAGVQASMLLSSFDVAGERMVGFGQRVADGTISALGQASVAPLAAQMPFYLVATVNPDTGAPFTPADVSTLGYTISLDL